MPAYSHQIQTWLAGHANAAQAGPMAAYMRDQFPFLGIKSPERKALQRDFIHEHGLPSVAELAAIVRELWALPEREYQYVALDLLERSRARLTPNFIDLFAYLTVTKSWWDTVDAIASHQVGDLLRRFPDLKGPTIDQWRRSDNIWLRRVTLLFQLRYKAETDVALLLALIEENLGSDEFFINKAIGWALREYSKVDEQLVRDFVAGTPLAPLSQREALKWLGRQRQ